MTGPIAFQPMPVVTNLSAADMPTHLGLISGTAQRSNANFAAISAWATRRLSSRSYYHETDAAVLTPDAHWAFNKDYPVQGYRVPLAGSATSLCVIFGCLNYISTATFTPAAGSGDLPTDLPLYTPTVAYRKTISDNTWGEWFPVTLLDAILVSGTPTGCYGGMATDIAGGATLLLKVSMPGVTISKAAGTEIFFTHTYLTGATA